MYKFLFFIFALFAFTIVPAQQKMKNYNNIIKSHNIYELDAFLRDAHPDDPRRSVLKPRLMDLLADYIKKAHPDDQRVADMQEKLAMLKRRPSTKISFDEMNEIIRQKQIRYYQEQLAKAQRELANPTPKTIVKKTNVPTPERETTPKRSSIFTKKSSSSTSSATEIKSVTNKSSSVAVNYENPEQAEFEMLMNPSAEEHKNKTVKVLNSLFDNDPTSKDTTVLIENLSDCDMIMRIEGTGYTKYRLAVPAKGQNTIVILKGQYLFSSLVCGAQYASQKTVGKAIMVSLGNPTK
ncbi:MAG: hypothetical protein ABS44_08415 [Chryseobacterium sp. SCN 40-13]|nr:MAG: hypothetical protein ABS44_08415 [Chryseobacterium sp. SCN 40-13]